MSSLGSLEETVSLQVRDSLIPGAGQGLFVTCSVKKGQVICEYRGKVLSTVEAMRSQDKAYLMRLGPQVYVDAKDCPEVWARYINDCRNPMGHNVYFDKRPKEQRALVVALRDLEAVRQATKRGEGRGLRLIPFMGWRGVAWQGVELWADYGRWYWASKAGTRLDDHTACQLVRPQEESR